MAEILKQELHSVKNITSLREFISDRISSHIGQPNLDAWHRSEVKFELERHRYGIAAWHLWQLHDDWSALQLVNKYPTECAKLVDCNEILARLDLSGWSIERRFTLSITEAAVHRAQNRESSEESSLLAALRAANECRHLVLLGRAYSELGKFYETRNTDRALACYRSCIRNFKECFDVNGNEVSSRDQVAVEYSQALVRLAWLYLRRNDPRAKIVLEEAQRVSKACMITLSLQGQIEQTFGEYWRCIGSHAKALEHKHEALNFFLQAGEQRSVLTTYLNLSLVYAELKDFPLSIEYGQKVLAASNSGIVDAELLLATFGNLGVAYFWQDDFEKAIKFYNEALKHAEAMNMEEHIGNLHLNLAEAYYKLFQVTGNADAERNGDSHLWHVKSMGLEKQSPRLLEASASLKANTLSNTITLADKLVSPDVSINYSRMLEIRDYYGELALASTPEEQASLHLNISKSFLSMALKERDEAMKIIRSHALTHLEGTLDILQQTWAHDGNLASQLNSRWREQVGDWLTDSQRKAVLERLLAEGSLSKSSYGEAAEVSPATASKHLGLLADKGLLEQQGRGPATRYVLPGEASSGSPATPPVH